MADEQVPTPASPQPAPLTFLEKLQAPADLLWSQYKVFFIVFGVLILIYKFRELFISLLVADSKAEVQKDLKKDEQLLAKENRTNDEANQLRQQAEDLAKNKPAVDENWNKKK